MKGQWYIVAGVLITFSLISFFYTYHSYSTIDLSQVLKNNEDRYILNIINVLNEIKSNAIISENKLADIHDLLEMVRNSLKGNGYLVNYSYNLSNINLTIMESKMKINITN